MKFVIEPEKIKYRKNRVYQLTIPKFIMENFDVSKVVVVYNDTNNKKISRFGKRSKKSQKKLGVSS